MCEGRGSCWRGVGGSGKGSGVGCKRWANVGVVSAERGWVGCGVGGVQGGGNHVPYEQAMRDTFARVETPGEAASYDQCKSWSALSRLYARGFDVDLDEQAPRQRRLASYHHNQCLDHMLRSVTSFRGLCDFMSKEVDAERDLLSLPALVTNEDAGPIPSAAKWFRIYHLKLRELPHRDPFHALWRVFINGVAEAGLRGVMLVTGLEANLSRGPWRGGGWAQNLKERAKDYFSMAGRQDPLFQSLVRRICMDIGDVDAEIYPDVVDSIFDGLQHSEFLMCQGPAVQHSRWMSWQTAMDWLLPQRTKRLVILLFAGLQEGYLLKAAARLELKSLTSGGGLWKAAEGCTGATSSSAEKAPMAVERDKLDAIRDRCTNTMHVCTLIAANQRYATGARIILYCSDPYRAWQQHWRHFLRDRSVSLKFSIDMARGTSILETIHRSFGVLADPLKLAEIGLDTSGLSSDKSLCNMTADHPYVQAQDDQAASMARLLISFAAASSVRKPRAPKMAHCPM